MKNKVVDFLLKHWVLIAFCIFIPLLFVRSIGAMQLPSPDSSPFCNTYQKWEHWMRLLCRPLTIAPYDIMEMILPLHVFNDLSYPLEIIFACLGFYLWQRARGFEREESAFGAGIYALSGYSFTLVFAGHRSWFTFTVYVIFMFAFLARAIYRKSRLDYALTGALAAWVIRFAPDMAIPMLVVAASYALFLLCKLPSQKGDGKGFWKGVGITALVFLVFVPPSIYDSFENALTGRQKQLSDMSDNIEDEAAKKESDWIFATNWSLPPEETLEFVAPGIKGLYSGSRERPYWGRLGETYKYEETEQGYMNYRQHIVYLGAVPLGLALFALIGYFTKRRTGEFTDTPFWLAIFAVGLLLAFGRYTPFYKLYYAIPYISYLRAPVKFMRIVEIATAVLAVNGLSQLLAKNCATKLRRNFGFICIAISAAFTIYAMYINANPGAFANKLTQIGAPKLIRPMTLAAVGALWHAILGFAALAATSFSLADKKWRAMVLLTLFVIGDLALALWPFTVVTDVSVAYKESKIADIIHKEAGPVPKVCMIANNPGTNIMLGNILTCHDIATIPEPYQNDCSKFFAQTRGDVYNLCRIRAAKFIIADAEIAKHLGHDDFEHVAYFEATRQGMAEITKPTKTCVELLRVKNAYPEAAIFTSWRTGDNEKWIESVAKDMRDTRIMLISEAVDGAPNTGKIIPAQIKEHRYFGGNTATIVETSADEDGILFLAERDYKKVYVDGKEAKLLKAGFAGSGVFLPKGDHTVSFSMAPKPLLFAIYTILMLIFMAGATISLRESLNANE